MLFGLNRTFVETDCRQFMLKTIYFTFKAQNSKESLSLCDFPMTAKKINQHRNIRETPIAE
jgi:hypothetical protein